MKKHWQWSVMLIGGIGLALTSGCGNPAPETGEETVSEDARVFEVQGRVRGISGDRETLTIEHEEIPGFMAAMTMPFYLTDPELAEGLEPGDAVGFRYVVRSRESYIDRIEKLDDDAVPAAPAGGGIRRTADSRVPRLEAGDRVPDFRLVNQDGDPFYLHEFGDRAIVLTFIFTRCPVPDFCPLMSENFRAIQQRVADDPDLRGKVQLLSVTIDPEFDTPEVLAEYAARYTEDDDTWTFATGARDRIDELTTRFSVYIEDAVDSGNIDHALATVLISPERRIEEVWRGNAWSPDEVVAALRESMNESIEP